MSRSRPDPSAAAGDHRPFEDVGANRLRERLQQPALLAPAGRRGSRGRSPRSSCPSAAPRRSRGCGSPNRSRTDSRAPRAPGRPRRAVAGVEDEAVHPLRGANGQVSRPDAPVLDGREVVARDPAAGIALGPPVVEPRLEGLEQGVGVPVEIVADLVEIEEAPVRSAGRRPRNPSVREGRAARRASPRRSRTGPSRSGGVSVVLSKRRRSSRGPAKIGIMPMLSGSLAVVRTRKVEPDSVRVDHLDGFHLGRSWTGRTACRAPSGARR